MNQVQLLVVLHAHQPVGSSDDRVAGVHLSHYRPLLDALLANPAARLTLHFSGALLEWLESDAPESIGVLKQLVERGQVEMLGGGAYEPLLTLLSDWDAQSQLSRMQELVTALVGRAPSGVWLTRGLWEPDLPRLLGPAGLQHAVLGHNPFEWRAFGYGVTERVGRPMALFAPDAALTHHLRSAALESFREELAAVALLPVGPGGRGACAALDLNDVDAGAVPLLISALADLGPEVEPLRLADYLERFPPRGFVRVSSAGPEALRSGAHLARLPEARALHTRMQHAAKNLLEVETELGVGTGSLGEARRALLRGQGHVDTADSRLRHAAYAHLIECENLVDADQRGEGDYIEYEEDDFDADLRDEAVLANAHLAAWVDPTEGGALTELDDRAHSLALIQIPPGLEGSERASRRSFVDRFLSATLTLEQAASGELGEQGDFSQGPYVVEASGVDEEGDLSASITLVREATVRTEAGPRPLLVEKTYHMPVDAPRLEVEYILENPGPEAVDLLFAPEVHLVPYGGTNCSWDLGDGRRESLSKPANLGRRASLVLTDSESGVRLSLGSDSELEIWTYPVASSGAYEATCVLLRLPVVLPAGESRRVRFTVQVTDLE